VPAERCRRSGLPRRAVVRLRARPFVDGFVPASTPFRSQRANRNRRNRSRVTANNLFATRPFFQSHRRRNFSSQQQRLRRRRGASVCAKHPASTATTCSASDSISFSKNESESRQSERSDC
jgi:hypothetical protein